MKPVISAKNLTRTYKTHKRKEGLLAAFASLFKRDVLVATAVKKISFSINVGEIVGFVGQNGAGKSTTIKMLTGVLHPTSGEIKVLDFIPWDERTKYVRNIGVVFGQKSQLWWDIPPIDAFHLAKAIYGIPDKDFGERLGFMATILNVHDVMYRPTRDLSLGERMKCEFMMALLHNPQILFLDEPTIGVDALAKEEIREFLKKINQEYKTTIILTTHDMDDIEELCERVIVIDQGAIIYDGALASVKQKYVKWKTIEIEISRVKNEKKFYGLLEEGVVHINKSHYVSLRIPTEHVHPPTFVKNIMNCCDVLDLSVHEPRLEHVIKEIYREKNAHRNLEEEAPKLRVRKGKK